MPDYRLYCLDSAGKISAAEWLSAKDDDEAIVIARSLNKGVGCELWGGNRLIAKIPMHSAA